MVCQKTVSHLLYIPLILLSSCGLNDLEDRIDRLENKKRNLEQTLGTNESFILDFTYTEPNTSPVTLKKELSLKSQYTTNLISPVNGGFYRISLERFSDIGYSNTFYINMIYNPTIDSISDYYVSYSVKDDFAREHRVDYSKEMEEYYEPIKLHIFELDVTTGKVEFTIQLQTPSF
jgi:hypothetical protein